MPKIKILLFKEAHIYNSNYLAEIESIDIIPCLLQNGNEILFCKKFQNIKNNENNE